MEGASWLSISSAWPWRQPETAIACVCTADPATSTVLMYILTQPIVTYTYTYIYSVFFAATHTHVGARATGVHTSVCTHTRKGRIEPRPSTFDAVACRRP